MLNSSYESSTKPADSQNQLFNSQHNSTQHGFNLLAKENLTHITSYLDPPALFALSEVNRFLHEHVQDDHTWRRAFLLNFLGIKPEVDLDPSTGLLLRRSESSWAKEYVVRCNTRRRWECLRNSTIAYVPVHSRVSDIHLLRNQAQNSPHSTLLLSSSLQYGIVSRSILFAGKVVRGFISPSPSGTGLGIGNPNTEFAPDVTACSVTSEGGTAKIFWGMRSGEVAVSVAQKALDTNTRSAAKLTRCSVLDQHDAEVVEIVWDDSKAFVASASKDRRIKIWDAKTAVCLWTSEYLGPDYPTMVRLSYSKRLNELVLVAGMKSVSRGTKLKIRCPVQQAPTENNQVQFDPTIASVHLDIQTDSQSIRVIVSYDGQPEFYRIDVPVGSAQFSIITFKETHTFIGTISTIFPSLSSHEEPSFILAGTTMGWICVYPYPSQSTSTVIEPVRKFEAHVEGSGITALAWNHVTLVTGSTTGTTSVFDAYTFEKLRMFATPIPRPRGGNTPDRVESVKKIVLSPENDVMAVAIGDRVMGFKAEFLPTKSKFSKVLTGKKKSRGTTTSKGYAQHDLKQLVKDSVYEQNEKKDHMQKVYARERQQRADLDVLGLDEVEAVEYALMLSREEALAREAREERDVQSLIEEGVFEGDFDFGEGPSAGGPSASATSTPPSSNSSEAGSPSGLVVSSSGSPHRSAQPVYSSYTPPRRSSNRKIQVSPRLRAEAKEAGWGGEGSPPVAASWGSVASSVSDIDLGKAGEHFPSISPKMTKSTGEGSTRNGAWGTGSWSPSMIATTSSSSSKQPKPGATHSSSTWKQNEWRAGEDEDEDLKLAIQLSLEEAGMRGEVV